ncbi:unnamed protein product [Heligmosomoides polygyrus]|uniref:Endo/exonuclease/phosphatase domain-containing protein n=1 Tax=Heligmosomoides polygyrus TaxID=6339 RepID=A0A183FNL1_HELPZ|nr:unnamed protein product [Heligmosomoides polygyrus]
MDSLLLLCRVDAFLVRGSGMFMHSDVIGIGLPETPSHHGNFLFVCTYNCRSIASEQDLRTLLCGSRNIKYDVIALQETKGRTETIRKTDHNELLIIGAKVDRKNIGGVGFLVNSAVHHLVDSHKIISPRIAVLRLETKDQGAISIINGYAPTSDEEKEEFYKLFERTVNDEKSYYKVVVGDFNATDDGPGKAQMEKHVRRSTMFLQTNAGVVRPLRAAFI